MCPKSSDQFENIRKEKRQLILDTSLQIFGKKGYHAASIANIASQAGISKGLIYNYFDSKEAILEETLTTGMELMFKQFRFNPENQTPEQFARLIDLTFDILDKDFSYWKIYFSVLLQTDVMSLFQDKLMEILIPIIESFALFLGKMGFEQALEEARFFGAMLDGLIINYITDPENFPKEYCIKRLKSIYNLPQ